MFGLGLAGSLGVIIIGLLVLAKSAHLVITAIEHLSHWFHISEFVSGFIILGIATSTPEIFVGVQSALNHTPALSLGNLLGADIVLLTAITGVTAIVSRGISVHQSFGRLVQICILIAAPLILLVDQQLSRADGLILLTLYLGYLAYVYATRPPDRAKPSLVHHHLFHTLLVAAVGLGGLLFSSRVIVLTAISLADLLHVGPLVVGTLLLSVGTNLPEITLVIESLRRRHSGLIIGDVLGSAATNSFVIALLALISPFSRVNLAGYTTTGLVVLATLLLFVYFSHTKRLISRWEGLVLVGLYLVFVAISLGGLTFA